MGENTEDYDITLLSAEEAMRQIVKGYVITPRLLKEGEPVAAELPDYLSDFKDVFSEREASILSEDMGVEYAIDLERSISWSRSLERCRFGGVQHQSDSLPSTSGADVIGKITVMR